MCNLRYNHIRVCDFFPLQYPLLGEYDNHKSYIEMLFYHLTICAQYSHI